MNKAKSKLVERRKTYHCDISVCFEELRDFSQLVFKVVHPDILNVRPLVGDSLKVSQLIFVGLLQVEWLRTETQRLSLLLAASHSLWRR